jgi:phenylalanyl-tRNA synthetase beta chain
MALVCDAEGPSGIAGVMGGLISEVSDSTTRVLMEAATWVGTNILQTSNKLGLRTEASARFEKQLHPELGMAAQRLAARLMLDLCGARMVDTVDVYPEPLPPRTVRLRLPRVEKLVGVHIPHDESRAILERLGFEVSEADAETWEVGVPYWRDGDVQREADVIEEIARVYGLEKVPTTMPARKKAIGRLAPEQALRRRLEDGLRDRGLFEAVGWSFTAPETLTRLRLGDVPGLPLANPLSEDMSVMRPLLLPGLLDAARHNAARGRADIALFESAHVYAPAGLLSAVDPERSPAGSYPAAEHHHLGVLLAGRGAAGWRTPPPPVDFYRVKGVAEAVLEAARVDWRVEPGERPFLHPGRSAVVLATDGRELGWAGELHPLVAREWDLENAAAFELDLDLVAELAPGPAQYEELSPFPPVIQDIAVVVPEDVPAGDVRRAIREAAGDLLARLELFDVYRGTQVGQGNKSLALRVEFQARDRTLTDDEVAGVRALIEDRLSALGGRVRGSE